MNHYTIKKLLKRGTKIRVTNKQYSYFYGNIFTVNKISNIEGAPLVIVNEGKTPADAFCFWPEDIELVEKT